MSESAMSGELQGPARALAWFSVHPCESRIDFASFAFGHGFVLGGWFVHGAQTEGIQEASRCV